MSATRVIEPHREGPERGSHTDDREVDAPLGPTMSLAAPPHVIVLVERNIRRRTIRALGYGASLRARTLAGVHVAENPRAATKVARRWERRCPGVMLHQIEAGGRGVAETIRALAASEVASGATFVAILPEREHSLRARFGLTQPSLEIVEALRTVPNASALILPR